jgi:hypothetical protein
MILGKSYKIIKGDRTLTEGNMGQMSRAYQTIKLDLTVAKEQTEETLLHEVLHAIDEELMLDFDESTIARLAVGLYSAGYRLPRVM